MFLSTDAEKSFDRVNWSFVFGNPSVLWGGDRMMQWIAGAHTAPTALVKVNVVFSDPITILNWTRQECPLSPLLFPPLTLEPFLGRVRWNDDIKGLQIGNSDHKVSTYVDDLLFFLTNPPVSRPNLLQELERYGALSNLKINYSKSEAMGVKMTSTQLHYLQLNFKFNWTSTALKYLGTFIPSSLANTYKLTFPPLLATVRKLLDKWQHGLHSWFGQCNLIKMSILPKFLYLFQALPIHIPSVFFKQVSTLINKFIWADKRPRIRRGLLTLQTELGYCSTGRPEIPPSCTLNTGN